VGQAGDSGRGGPTAWDDAVLAAMLLATDPTGLGLVLRAPAGPVRDHWLQCLGALLAQHDPPLRPRRVPLSISDERLLGGLDLTATLQAGRPVAQRGLLAEADGGLLLVPMAERLPPGLVGHLAAMLDQGEVRVERDGISARLPARCGLLLLDESAADDEAVPQALADRLALHLDLTAVAPREALATPIEEIAALADIAAAQGRLHRLTAGHPPGGHGQAGHQAPGRPEGPGEGQGSAAETLCAAADALGVDSLRAVLAAVRAARVHAALVGAQMGEDAAPGADADADDLRVALRLVLLPRATRLPAAPPPEDEPAEAPEAAPEPATPPAEAQPDQPPPPEPPTPPPPIEDGTDPDPLSPPDPADMPRPPAELLLEAALAALPPDLLLRLRSGAAVRAGRSRGGGAGQLQRGAARGRPAGVRRALPRAGQRLNLVETLRAAIPWQRLRERPTAPRLSTLLAGAAEGAPGPSAPGAAPAAPVADPARTDAACDANLPPARRRIQVRPEDFHVTQLQQPRQTTTIFAVDASGSSALGRLAEAKGAVELLLADCYVRRDRVAVIAFRGRAAELLLPPTRSLVRAKRSLAGLPGGGGTPLASALQAAAGLADAVQRRGETAVLVLLTDGRANVALDGTGGRARADADAMQAAQQLRLLGATVLLIDTSPQPQAAAARLAQALQARYLPLPQADARRLSQAVRAAV
jgi:magnesium chelatase subunit D